MPAFTRRKLILGSSAIAAAGAATFWLALPKAQSPAKTFAVDGIAIRGTDPVAYFEMRRPVPGTPEFAHDWAGATWLFSSAENLERFAANPVTYAPQYGGFCAWAVAVKGKLFSTQPDNWTIVDNRLYLNYNHRVQERWNADIPGFISRGNERWPQIVSAT